MSDTPSRADVLAALGLRKAPELATLKGQVPQDIAESLRFMAQESGVREEEVVGLAVTEFVRRAERRLARIK